jgi:2-polyprenyl-3-methyl-5-hydroxy-6-metoxy-1,4-benzoquinol methylase
MEENFEKKYHDVETNHWWFKSRRKYLIDLLKNIPKDSKILDIGCSSGVLLKDLENLGFDPDNLFGIDISEKAILNSKKKWFEKYFCNGCSKYFATRKI